MAILSETSLQVSKDTKIYTNKLKNMKLHLSELLNKKLRLEVEIKSLVKTIAGRQKEYERTLKVKLAMESTEFIDSSPRLKHLLEDPQLCRSLQDFDEISFDIRDLLEEKQLKEEL